MTETHPDRVLLVEDDPADARLITEYVTEQDWPSGGEAPTVQHVERLADAVDARDVDTDVVLLDLGLPDSSPFETLETMLAASGNEPVVVLTGLDDEKVGIEAIERGAQDYLLKDDLTAKLLRRTLQYAVERERRETELKRANTLFQNAQDGLFVVDVEDGGETFRIDQVNRAYEAYTGASADELQGKTIREIADEMDSRSIRKRYQECVGTRQSLEYEEHIAAFGGGSWWETRISPVTVGDEVTQIVGSTRDITERKEKEEEITTHLNQAQEIGNVGSWQLDLDDETLHWSDECYRIFGIQPERPMTYERFVASVHPEDRDAVEEAWVAALEGDPYEVEHRIVVDDEIRWVLETAEVAFDEDGEPTEGIGVVRDITERKQREREIRAQKRQYESLFDSIRDPIVVTDTDGCITNCNPGFSELFGYEHDDIDGKPFEILGADRTDRVRTADGGEVLNGAVSGDGNSAAAEILSVDGDWQRGRYNRETVDYRKQSGRVFPGESTVSPLQNHEGKIEGLIVHIRDVSERNNNQRQLMVLDRVLRHNIKNDMNVVMGHAEIIRQEDPIEVRESVETILRISQGFVEMANKQQDVTSLLAEPSSRTTLDLVPIVRDVVSGLRGQYPSADLSTSFEESQRVTATYDIAGAVEELIRNAVVHSDRAHPSVHIEVQADDDHTTVRVADDGPGIDRQEAKVLRRDAKIGPVYHGSGLGLWLVRVIVRQSNGQLTFRENASGGTTVAIHLSRE